MEENPSCSAAAAANSEKKRIREMIVVEGKNDTQRLKQYFSCDTIETGGDHVSAECLERIAAAQKIRGVIVFTDPDGSGERIRRIVTEHIPGVKQAFIEKDKAKTPRKVGVEHALRRDLEESLSHLCTFEAGRGTLSRTDFIDAGLSGNAALRSAVCRYFHIGRCNAKTCFKRLNQLGITGRDLFQALASLEGQDWKKTGKEGSL